jgi:hypothetical protein
MSAASAAAARHAEHLCTTAARTGWTGPDVYDALAFRWPRVLVAGRRRRQAVLQVHARLPWDLRRFYGHPFPLISKTLAVFGLAELSLYRGGLPDREAPARRIFEMLAADRSTGTPAWGYPWDMQTRWSFYPADTPNVVATSFAGDSLAAAGEAFDSREHRARAAAAAEWVQESLYSPKLGCYVYHPHSDSVIHNANLLGARLVHELVSGDADARSAVNAAVERTLGAQLADGSWPYGEGPGLGFVDSFHTGYVLESLVRLSDVDPAVNAAVARGAEYYSDRFFGPDGSARLWPDRPFPLDAHAAGTGMTTLAALATAGFDVLGTLGRLAEWSIAQMLTKDGHAIYRRYRLVRTRVNYVRWADSHMALGLANAARALRRATTVASHA